MNRNPTICGESGRRDKSASSAKRVSPTRDYRTSRHRDIPETRFSNRPNCAASSTSSSTNHTSPGPAPIWPTAPAPSSAQKTELRAEDKPSRSRPRRTAGPGRSPSRPRRHPGPATGPARRGSHGLRGLRAARQAVPLATREPAQQPAEPAPVIHSTFEELRAQHAREDARAAAAGPIGVLDRHGRFRPTQPAARIDTPPATPERREVHLAHGLVGHVACVDLGLGGVGQGVDEPEQRVGHHHRIFKHGFRTRDGRSPTAERPTLA